MRQPITYADTRTDLPQSDFAKRLAELRIARTFEAANTNDRSPEQLTPGSAHSHLGTPTGRSIGQSPNRRSSHTTEKSMVEQEQPHPAPRPNLPFAEEVDASSFNARWEAQRQRATQSHPTSPNQGDTLMSDDNNTPNRPAETLREGSLKAAIWRNESERGAYHSVTIARTYKDQDGNFHDTSSFRAQDMLGLAELARQAHHQTHDLDRAAFKEQRQAQEQQAPAQSQGHSR